MNKHDLVIEQANSLFEKKLRKGANEFQRKFSGKFFPYTVIFLLFSLNLENKPYNTRRAFLYDNFSFMSF